MSAVPPRRPERAPEWDPHSERYWDERDLEDEVLRHFQICADCRMCVTYCGSFPVLFDAVDREVDAGRAESVETLGPETIDAVADHCWQCKLCYIKCPYTEDEDAYELLDFPRLVTRVVAQRTRRNGVPLVDQALGEPALLGRLSAGPPAGVANLINENRLVRKAVEKATGVSADFPLPRFAPQPFAKWFEGHDPLEQAGERGRVVLFSTCTGDYNTPEIPRASTRVLERNGFEVIHAAEAACCGIPNLDGGDLERARSKMQQDVDVLLPWVREGLRVAVPSPTCAYTLKKEMPTYLGTPEGREVAEAVVGVMELLEGLRREKQLDKDFETGLGKVAYHVACHLRAQKIAVPGARILMRIPDTQVRLVEACSAVDGTWGMKAQNYDEGRRYAKKLAREMSQDDDERAVGDCNLAGLRVEQETGKKLVHPAVALAEAYGLSERS